ncbi:MAG: hypothetical protein IKB23_00710 [Clostridia bacterium]|nr:hypothetical protein [Clostridia bacterium]
MENTNVCSLGYLIITDHVKANTGEDVSDAIQKIIDENPHRTIYFPDGEYILSKPICTPADPRIAVSLELSCFAILRASDDWSSDEAMVRLGGKYAFNNIHLCGSNYYFKGGIIDGNKIAKGISIDSGRETLISHVSIKNTTLGIHIKRGANSGSSDADIDNVNITGNRKVGSIGVYLEGLDNTLTNMRIAAIQTGVLLHSGGNFLRNIHPLGGVKQDEPEYYANSCAFRETTRGGNFYDSCYSDNFAVGFESAPNAKCVYNDCFCYWYSPLGDCQVGFRAKGKFNSMIKNAKVSFNGKSEPQFNAFLQVEEEGGNGVVMFPMTPDERMEDKTYKDYLFGTVI